MIARTNPPPVRNHPALRADSGFSLVELALALLVVGMGVMTAFSLFPKGLYQADSADADNRIGVFATFVLNGMQANAMVEFQRKDQWDNLDLFSGKIVDIGPPQIVDTQRAGLPTAKEIEFPPGSDEWLRYRLEIGAVPGVPDNRYAILKIWPNRYGSEDADSNFREFYLEMYYNGPR